MTAAQPQPVWYQPTPQERELSRRLGKDFYKAARRYGVYGNTPVVVLALTSLVASLVITRASDWERRRKLIREFAEGVEATVLARESGGKPQ